MATERDRLVRLEGMVESLQAENKSLRSALNDLWKDIYGQSPGDKNSIVYQMQMLISSRAVQIWLVSIMTGIGSAVAAAYIISQFKH